MRPGSVPGKIAKPLNLKLQGIALRPAQIAQHGSARLNSFQSSRKRDYTHLGRYSLSYLLGHFDLDDVPNQAPRSFNKREFVRQAAFKQHADAIVAGYIPAATNAAYSAMRR